MNDTVVWSFGWVCSTALVVAMLLFTSRCQIEEQHDVTKRVAFACQGDISSPSRAAVCAAAVTKGEHQ
jgi:hypothetical protein